MHPLNKLLFGVDGSPGSIKVHFNNGSAVVTGWIVRQPSYTKWLVTADGDSKFLCELTATATPAAGQFTIFAYPLTNGTPAGSPIYVGRIDGHHIVGSDGIQYIWSMGSPAPTGAGYAELDHF